MLSAIVKKVTSLPVCTRYFFQTFAGKRLSIKFWLAVEKNNDFKHLLFPNTIKLLQAKSNRIETEHDQQRKTSMRYNIKNSTLFLTEMSLNMN